MKILITGGTNFVSRYTAEYFAAKGCDVTVLNRGSRPQPAGVTHICCDKLQLGDTLKGAHYDAVLDITGYTEEHVKAIVDSGVTFGDYVFISSSAVYPETNAQPFSEDQEIGHNSVWGDYGENKVKAERFLREKVPGAYILRPPYLYGIYDYIYREAFSFDCAIQDRPFYIPGDGSMKMQFFNVSDLCRIIEILLEKHPRQRVFNVGNKELVTIREWVELCYNAAGKKPQLISVDEDVPQREFFPFHKYEYALDVSRQSELLPDTVSLEKGLKEEYDWYKDNPDSIYFRKPYIEYIENNLA